MLWGASQASPWLQGWAVTHCRTPPLPWGPGSRLHPPLHLLLFPVLSDPVLGGLFWFQAVVLFVCPPQQLAFWFTV